MTNNNVVHITPPSLYINNDGTQVLFLGFNENMLEDFQSVFERNFYDSELQFFYSDKKNDEEIISWKYFVSKEVDFIILNLDSCSTEELVISLMTENNFDDKNVVFFTNNEGTILTNIVQKYTGKVIKSIEDFEEILKFIIED
jgi:hypothetical protein